MLKNRSRIPVVDFCLQSAWIFSGVSFLLFFTWLYIYTEYNQRSTKCLYTPKLSQISKGTGKNGQEILERSFCPQEGFDSESIVKTNSRSLPQRSWTYDSNNGICEGEDAKNCLPGFINVPKAGSHEYALSNPTKSIHCVVAKSMSRVFKTLALFLNDPLEFFYLEKDIIEDVFTKEKYNGDVWNKPNDWAHVMIVRDPIERFLSGYTHICLLGKRETCDRFCNGCGSDIACFLEKQIENSWKMVRREKSMDFTMQHMMPQTWYCDLDNHFHKYKFLRYNSDSAIFFDQELRPYLQSRNVSESAMKYIRSRMVSTRTSHSTTDFGLKNYLDETVRSSPYIMEKLIRLFYHDYVAFNFTLPTILTK